MSESLEEMPKISLSATDILSAEVAINKLVSAVENYMIIAEQEATKRAAISAQASIEIERIAALKQTLSQYIDRSFSERSDNFVRLFDLVDQAMKSGDNQVLSAQLGAIISLAQISPIAQISDLNMFKRSLLNEEEVWEI